MEFAAFADESSHTEGRFRSIATVSFPRDQVLDFQDRIRECVDRADVSEFKWRKLRRRKYVDLAIRMLEVMIEDGLARGARVDCVIWDTEDNRHSVENRDDIANYERMFFHLHRDAFRRRGKGSKWHLRPDVQMSIDWDTVRSCLNASGTWRREQLQSELVGFGDQLRPYILSFKEVESTNAPLCQLGDLFAGIGRYTRDRSAVISSLIRNGGGQAGLFPGEIIEETEPSGRDSNLFPVVWRLYELCSSRSLGVSLRTEGYLKTRDPRNPINFWHYVPQRGADKAPTKNG